MSGGETWGRNEEGPQGWIQTRDPGVIVQRFSPLSDSAPLCFYCLSILFNIVCVYVSISTRLSFIYLFNLIYFYYIFLPFDLLLLLLLLLLVLLLNSSSSSPHPCCLPLSLSVLSMVRERGPFHISHRVLMAY